MAQSDSPQARDPASSAVQYPPSSGEENSVDSLDADELGYLDYMEIGESANSVLSASLERMTSAMNDLGANSRKRAAEAEEASASPSLTSAKGIANAAAMDLQAFANTTSAEVATIGEAYGDVLRAFSGAASVGMELGHSQDKTSEALSQVEQLRAAVEATRGQLQEFTEGVRTTPRMTIALNRARLKAMKVLASLDSELGKAVANSLMVENSIRDLINAKQSSST
jgi:hypothetical protein